MSKKEFEEFLTQEEEKKKPSIDWDQRKKWWIEKLENLYSNIQGWLKEYVESDKITLEFKNIEIFEEALGIYPVRQLTVKIGDKVATLTPVGTILLGARGRVDMSGKVETMRFILVDKHATKPNIEFKVFFSDEEKRKDEENQKKKPKLQIEWVWKITSYPPKIKYTELNEDTFLDSLIQVCNG